MFDFLFKKKYKFTATIFNEKGLAALPTVIVLSVVVLIVGVGINSGGFIENIISNSQSQSSESFYIAESGAEDALLRIARNRDFGNTPQNYGRDTGLPITVAPDDISVSVSGATTKTIDSTATIKDKSRKVRAVTVDATPNGKVTVSTWEERND